MRRSLWAPILAIATAALILVPTTLAVGEPGTTLYAQLGFNRFPNGLAAVESQLHFLEDGSARLDVRLIGGTGRRFAVRVYADGTCTNPGRWIINRAPGAGLSGPFLEVMGNTTTQFIVNPLDLQRIREEIAGNPNEQFALAIAFLNPVTGLNFRTCTPFRATPFAPITTSTTTTTASPTATTTAGSVTTARTTTTATNFFTSLSTSTSFLTTTSGSVGTTFGVTTTPVSTFSTVRTTTVESVVTITTFGTVVTFTVSGAEETVTFTSATTSFSTITTGTTTFTSNVTVTTGTTFSTTTTVVTQVSTITL